MKYLLYLATLLGFLSTNAQSNQKEVQLKNLKFIGKVDERFQSFNIEMCEVIGGDFWIPYSLIDSVRKTTNKTGFAALKWKINPINLYDPKLRNLAAGLGPTYVRVSGTWANAVYFQNDDNPILEKAPEGFKNVLTRPQWKGVVDFCKAVNGKLVSSFPISDGMRDASGLWQPTQVKSLIDYTKTIGGDIYAAEFFNEPSHAAHGDAPKGYDGKTYAKEFSVFKEFANAYYPSMKIMGPGSIGEGGILPSISIKTDDILSSLPKPKFEIFSYHFYGTISKRCGGGQKPENALNEEWLSKTEKGLEFYENARNKYMPDAPIWLNETAEAACGGNPWAVTYLDSFRYIEQLGRLAKRGVQVVMHNTLARSEYGLLDHDTYNPRPNYWAALLWNKLMGTEVYQSENLESGIDVFVHNFKGKKNGKALVILNTNVKPSSVMIPSSAKQYTLTADELSSKKVKLNGMELQLKNDELPMLLGKKIKKGSIELPAHSIMFLTFEK